MPVMLEDHWYIACRSRALGRKPLAVTLFDKPLVLYRGPKNRALALEDRCLHRGAPLSAGRVSEGELQCPYHGWRYNAAGELAHIPAQIEPEAGSTPPCIQAYDCMEQDGYIWVCPGESPSRARPLSFAHLGERGWTSFRMDTVFEAPVEACLENFLDCPHATFVHRYWFRAPTTEVVRSVTRTLEDGALTEYFKEPRKKSLVWSLLSRDSATLRHTDRFIAPATSRVDYEFSDGRYYIITSSCTPISAAKTRVHTVISFRYPRLGPLVRLFFEPLSRLIIKQDVDILKRQQDNLRRFQQPEFRIIEQDVLIQAIQQWRKALREGGPTPEAGIETHVDLRL